VTDELLLTQRSTMKKAENLLVASDPNYTVIEWKWVLPELATVFSNEGVTLIVERADCFSFRRRSVTSPGMTVNYYSVPLGSWCMGSIPKGSAFLGGYFD
jgi:hypothetical protein